MAQHLHGTAIPIRRSAWYAKEEATFVDLLAAVRREFWQNRVLNSPTPKDAAEVANSPGSLTLALAPLLEAACYAA